MQRWAQRGAITIMTAAFLLLAVLCLVLVVDSGRLYLEKRKLQRLADVAVIEAVARNGDCTSPGALATTYATQAAVRNGYLQDADHTLQADCGNIDSIGGERVFSVQASSREAIRVRVSHEVPASLIAGGIFGNTITLRATAVASKGVPLAALTLRTTLVSIDSSQSAVLNTVLGGLLGTTLNVDALGWQGLLDTQIDLFNYLNLLKSSIGLSAGGYDEVLSSNVTLTQLVDVAITALQQGGGTGDVNGAIAGLGLLKLGLGPTVVQLGDILNLQTGTQQSGVDSKLNLFQLVQSSIMLANGDSAVAADIPITLPGGGGVTVAMKVIEPPQLSAIGNPELAQAEGPSYDGPNRIYVKSSQIRLYIGLSLGTLIQVVNDTLNGVLQLTSPVSSFLLDALGLNLVSAIGGLLNGLACDNVVGWPIDLFPYCTSRSVTYVKALADNVRVDVALQLGSGEGRVTGYTCGPADSKSLTVLAKTSIADVRVGRIGSDTNSNGTIEMAESRAAVFANAAMPAAAPIPILEFGRQTGRPSSCTLILCGAWEWFNAGNGAWVANRAAATYYPEAGLALRVGSESSGLGLTSSSLVYSAPPGSQLPEIGEVPAYKSLAASPSLLNTLSNLLTDINLEAYGSQTSGVVGNLLVNGVSQLSGVKDALQTIIGNLLSPLLDPIFDLLLDTLGLDLGKTEIGANLSCSSSQGVVLVQ